MDDQDKKEPLPGSVTTDIILAGVAVTAITVFVSRFLRRIETPAPPSEEELQKYKDSAAAYEAEVEQAVTETEFSIKNARVDLQAKARLQPRKRRTPNPGSN